MKGFAREVWLVLSDVLLAQHVLLGNGPLRLIRKCRLADDLASLVERTFLAAAVFFFTEDEALFCDAPVLLVREEVHFEVALGVFCQAAGSVSLNVVQS